MSTPPSPCKLPQSVSIGWREEDRLDHPREEGFLLLGALVAIALMLLVLAIAAPRVARELRREREVEAVHRGNQYVRAIQLYYRSFGHYPGSIEQLEKSNNIRFLRQRYSDPITGKDDFRTIPVGQNKTTVKSFFGQPLTGLASGGVGSVSSMASPGMGSGNMIGAASPTTSAFGGSTSAFGGSNSPPGTALPGSPPGTSAASALTGTGAPGAATAPGTSGAPGSTGTGSSAEPSVFSGTAQPFMGVGLGTKGDSIVEPNEQTSYDAWEFLYDPRLDQLKAKAAALNGGSIGSVPSNALGQGNSAFGSTDTSGAKPASPTGYTSSAPTNSNSTPGTQP